MWQCMSDAIARLNSCEGNGDGPRRAGAGPQGLLTPTPAAVVAATTTSRKVALLALELVGPPSAEGAHGGGSGGTARGVHGAADVVVLARDPFGMPSASPDKAAAQGGPAGSAGGSGPGAGPVAWAVVCLHAAAVQAFPLLLAKGSGLLLRDATILCAGPRSPPLVIACMRNIIGVFAADGSAAVASGGGGFGASPGGDSSSGGITHGAFVPRRFTEAPGPSSASLVTAHEAVPASAPAAHFRLDLSTPVMNQPMPQQAHGTASYSLAREPSVGALPPSAMLSQPRGAPLPTPLRAPRTPLGPGSAALVTDSSVNHSQNQRHNASRPPESSFSSMPREMRPPSPPRKVHRVELANNASTGGSLESSALDGDTSGGSGPVAPRGASTHQASPLTTPRMTSAAPQTTSLSMLFGAPRSRPGTGPHTPQTAHATQKTPVPLTPNPPLPPSTPPHAIHHTAPLPSTGTAPTGPQRAAPPSSLRGLFGTPTASVAAPVAPPTDSLAARAQTAVAADLELPFGDEDMDNGW